MVNTHLSIEIPDSVTSIGKYAFSCSGVKEFKVSDRSNFYTVNDGVLYTKDMKTLVAYPAAKEDETFVVPEYITAIYGGAFSSSKIKRLDILQNVKELGGYLFEGCKNLTEIHLVNKDPDSITIDYYTFNSFGVANVTLYVPIGTGYAYRHHPVFSKFKEVIIERYKG